MSQLHVFCLVKFWCEAGKLYSQMLMRAAEEAERGPVGQGREDPEGLPEPKYVNQRIVIDLFISYPVYPFLRFPGMLRRL